MESKKIKITELPLYSGCCAKNNREKKEPAGYLEPYVTQSRKEVETLVHSVLGDHADQINKGFQTSKQYFNNFLEHVRNEKNQAGRATFITSAAFFGFLLGRKGFFKRTLYAVVAAGASGAFCDPKSAKDYAEIAFELTKRKSFELYDQYADPSYLKNINLDFFTNKPEKK